MILRHKIIKNCQECAIDRKRHSVHMSPSARCQANDSITFLLEVSCVDSLYLLRPTSMASQPLAEALCCNNYDNTSLDLPFNHITIAHLCHNCVFKYNRGEEEEEGGCCSRGYRIHVEWREQ